MQCLRPTTKKCKNWFDEKSTEITQLSEDKHCVHRVHLDDPKTTAKMDRQKQPQHNPSKLLQKHDFWLSNKADEIQSFADGNDMKNFYDGLKEVCGSTICGSSPLLSAEGSTVITDKEKILERWAENLDSVLSLPSTINEDAIDWLPQAPFDGTLDAVPTNL